MYYVQLIHLRGILSKKQGDRSQTEQLLIELRVRNKEMIVEQITFRMFLAKTSRGEAPHSD